MLTSISCSVNSAVMLQHCWETSAQQQVQPCRLAHSTSGGTGLTGGHQPSPLINQTEGTKQQGLMELSKRGRP